MLSILGIFVKRNSYIIVKHAIIAITINETFLSTNFEKKTIFLKCYCLTF